MANPKLLWVVALKGCVPLVGVSGTTQIIDGGPLRRVCYSGSSIAGPPSDQRDLALMHTYRLYVSIVELASSLHGTHCESCIIVLEA